eukprot:13000957-Alexandrium_andersonii.AAC.1
MPPPPDPARGRAGTTDPPGLARRRSTTCRPTKAKGCREANPSLGHPRKQAKIQRAGPEAQSCPASPGWQPSAPMSPEGPRTPGQATRTLLPTTWVHEQSCLPNPCP